MNQTLTIMVSLIVAGVVFAASLPVLEAVTSSEEGVHNDGAGWVRFDLNRTANAEYTINIVIDEVLDTFSIANGTDTQTYDNEGSLDFETILYADSNVSVWSDNTAIRILGSSNGSPFYMEGWGNLDIVRTSEGVSIGYDDFFVSYGVPTWAYVPVSTGSYGFFMNGTEVVTYPGDMPIAAVGGGFAGVYAYDNHYRYDGLGLAMSESRTEDGKLNGVSWAKAVVEDADDIQMIDPSLIDFDPSIIDLDPIDLDPGAQLMSVPTPQYTDGDWGYNAIDGRPEVRIVSYSGAGGDVTVPATVGGHTVRGIGSGVSNQTVFPENMNLNVTISSGIEVIYGGSFSGCTGLTSVVMPDSITTIEAAAFKNCTGLTSVTLSNSITEIKGNVFSGCSSLNSIDIPSSVLSIKTTAFYNCTSLKSVVLHEGLTTIEQQAFQSCSGLEYLIIPKSVTSIGNNIVAGASNLENLIVLSDATPGTYSYSTSGVKNVLNLGSATYTTTSYGLTADYVSDSIGDALGYISVADIQAEGNKTVSDLLNILPLVMGAGMVLVAIGLFLWNRS